MLPIIACNRNGIQTTITSTDSLKKYSYRIAGFNGKSVFRGTGFFVNHNDRTFFITSKHLIAPFDSLCHMKKMPDYWRIFFPDILTKGKFKSIRIDINKIQDTIRCPVVSGIISIEIEDSINYKFFSVDLLSAASPGLHMPDSISVYGYPDIMDYWRPFLLKPPGHLVGICRIEKDLSSILHCKFESRKIDMKDSLRDYSGAPTFIKDNLSGKWLFLGAWLSASPHNKTMLVIKPSDMDSRILGTAR